MPSRKQPRPEAPFNVGGLVLDCVLLAEIEPKAAAAVMGWDLSQFYKAVDGDKGVSMDLWRVALLPKEFQRLFIAKYSTAIVLADLEARMRAAEQITDRRRKAS